MIAHACNSTAHVLQSRSLTARTFPLVTITKKQKLQRKLFVWCILWHSYKLSYDTLWIMSDVYIINNKHDHTPVWWLCEWVACVQQIFKPMYVLWVFCGLDTNCHLKNHVIHVRGLNNQCSNVPDAVVRWDGIARAQNSSMDQSMHEFRVEWTRRRSVQVVVSRSLSLLALEEGVLFLGYLPVSFSLLSSPLLWSLSFFSSLFLPPLSPF